LILIATNERDLTSDYVVLELQRRSLPVVRFNTEHLPDAQVYFRPSSGHTDWHITTDGSTIDFSEISAAYLRRPGIPIIPENVIGDAERRYCNLEWREFLSAAFWSLGNRWLNSPAAIYAAENKPRQLAAACELGFRIPETVITNSHEHVLELISAGQSVVKSLRTSLLEASNNERVIYTTRVTSISSDSAESIKAAPFIVQREIDKQYDLRVTVVGDTIFSTRIESQDYEETQTDWRRGARLDLPHRSHDLPSALCASCIRLTRALNLRFAAIDLILDKQGQYWFLEINPNGQWAWIQNRTGQRIDKAIVDELEKIAAS